ncbi:MAG TPA: O-antigen ligase family protein, partial [Terrimicrobiaceae bacterium]
MSNPIFFQEMWRMDWGLGNPNKTAALIAILVVAVWAIAYVRRWGFWVALVLFTGLGICLIHTFSRGGLIAAFAGLSILLWKLPRPWPRKESVAIIMSIWVIVGASIFLDAYARYGQGVVSEDRSITNRLALWKSAPAMMVDAPEGWGIGQSGISYVRWYQPLDRNEPYRTLVNSHLTWLVELGWPGRFLYLAVWALVLLFCWPTKDDRVLAISLGIWVSFGISAMFSSVAESIWLWIIPGLALALAVGLRIRRRSWPTGRFFLIPPAFAAAVCLAIFVIGSRSPSLVKRHGSLIVFGQGQPEYLVLADPATLGENYHRILRQSAERVKLPTIGIFMGSVANMADFSNAKVIVAGLKGSEHPDFLRAIFENAGEVILINPKLFPQEIGLPEAKG